MAPLSLSSRTARAGALALWLLLAVAWASALVSGLKAEDIAASLWSGVIVGTSGLILWRPQVRVTETDLTIVNPLREVKVSWAAITEIDTTWAMRVKTADAAFTAWAVIAPGRHAGFWASRDQTAHLPTSSYRQGTLRPSDLIGTESGEISAVIRRAWEAGCDRFPSKRDVEARIHPTAMTIAVMCVLGAIAATVMSVFPGA